jgi:putative ABC transport system permease protein
LQDFAVLSFVSLIARNSFRSRRRSVLTILSTTASFCMMGVLMSMYSLFFLGDPAPDQALRLIVRNRISFANPIPVSYVAKIKAVPGVREVMIQQWFGGTYKDSRQPGNNFPRFAIEPAKLFALHPEYAISRVEVERFLKLRDSCILGRTLALRLGMKMGDHVTLLGDIFPARLNLVVAGFYESANDDEALYFHNQYLRDSLRKDPDFAIMLMVMVDDLDSVTPVARRIDDLFRNSPVQTRTESERSFRLNFLSYVGNVKLFLFVVCALLAGTVLLVAANSITMSVRERAAEVGIMKAVGFAPNTILCLIAGEAMWLAAVGGFFGACGAQVFIFAMRSLPATIVSLASLSLSPELLAIELLLAAACGFAAAVPTAWRSSRRSIVDCLQEAE